MPNTRGTTKPYKHRRTPSFCAAHVRRTFFRWDAKKRTRHAFFHFVLQSVPFSWPQPDSWLLVRQTRTDHLLQPLFRHVLRALKNGGERTDTPEIKLAVAHMLTVFARGESGSGDFAPERWPDAVERAWNYLHQRLESEPDAKASFPAFFAGQKSIAN